MDEQALAKHNFSGWALGQEAELVTSLLMVKKACAQANFQAKVISSQQAQQIADACDVLMQNINEKTFPVDLLQGGGGIALNLNINFAICQQANGLTDQSVNASQSTADVVATALRLTLIHIAPRFLQELAKTIAQLRQKASEYKDLPTLARTCLRDAMVTTVGAKFAGYAANLQRRHQALEQALMSMHQLSLGGTVIGDGTGAPQEYQSAVIPLLGQITGFPLQSRADFRDGHQNIDELVQVSHELALLAESTIKMAKDLRLLHSGPGGGFGEITLPQVMAGSSFFKNKNNPTIVETLLQCCFVILGNDHSVSACLQHGELDLNTFEAMAGVTTIRSMKYLAKALHNFHQYALNDLTANRDRCQELSQWAAPAKEAKSNGDQKG